MRNLWEILCMYALTYYACSFTKETFKKDPTWKEKVR